MSLGVTPEMRLAWPMVTGRILPSFCRASWRRLGTPTIANDVVYFNGWTPGNDTGQQVELPAFTEVLAKADANHDGKLSQAELPQPWQPTGTWKAVDLDRDGLLNEREWTFFRSRRASRNSVLAVKLGGSGDVEKYQPRRAALTTGGRASRRRSQSKLDGNRH